jgi:hypothetical protein
MANDRLPDDAAAARSSFIHLAYRYLEHNLSAEELSAFKAELSDNPSRQDLFVELCLTRQSMVQLFRGRAQFEKQSNGSASLHLGDAMILPAVSLEDLNHSDEPQAQDGPPPLPMPQAVRWWQRRWAKAAAAVLPIIALPTIWYVSHTNPAPEVAIDTRVVSPIPEVSRSGTAPAPVSKRPIIAPPATAGGVTAEGVTARVTLPKGAALATLDLALDAEWDGGHVVFLPRTELPAGPHSLNYGTALLTLSGGASVVLEAPTQFEVVSKTQVILTRGQLSAQVPHTSAGLTVQTPDVTAIDLGTEFGVEVAPHRRTHLEVFDGRVRATIPSSATTLPAALDPSSIVTANHAVEVKTGSNRIETTPTTPLVFMRTQELIDCAAPGGNIGLSRWHAFSAAFRQDPDLVGYYTFDNQSEAPLKLLNRAVTSVGKHDADLGVPGVPDSIPGWNVGRWPGKGALHFGSSMNTVARIANGSALTPAPPFSYMIWLKREDVGKPVHLLNAVCGDVRCFDLSLIGTEGEKKPSRETGGLYFDLGPGLSAAQVQSQGAGKILPAVSKWFLLTLTVGPDYVAHVYVDGKFSGQFMVADPQLSRTQELWLGRPNPAAKDLGKTLILRGWVDELGIFRRVLSPREIKRIYQAGRPD